MTPIEYAIDVQPRAAVLGQPIVAALSCRATAHVAAALTFEHRSLVIEVWATGAPEPRLAFPNRFAIEDGGKLIRMASTGGVEELQAGDERARSFDLVTLFPHVVLAPGSFKVTYRLEEAEPTVRPEPVEVEVAAGPTAVPSLIGLLSADAEAVRSEAAERLEGMTTNDFGYDPDAGEAERGEAIQRWWAWWHDAGSKLPWST